MGRTAGVRILVVVVLALAGCAPLAEERTNELQQDGLLLFQRGNYAAARESFETALAIHPSKAALLYNIGQCSERLGDLAEAERAYQECLNRLPDHVPSRHALIGLMVKRGQTAQAREAVNEWLAYEPNASAPRAADGWLLHQTGDLLGAKSCLQVALRINGRDLKALTELGIIYEKMGRPDRALALYQLALEEDANQPEVVQRVQELKDQGVGPPRPE